MDRVIFGGGRNWRKTQTRQFYRLRFFNAYWNNSGGYSIPIRAYDIMPMLLGNREHNRAELSSIDKNEYGNVILSFVRPGASTRWYLGNSDQTLAEIPNNIEHQLK